MSSAGQASLAKLSLLYNMQDKNARAETIISEYAAKAALMAAGVGAVSWVPGLAIPAILANLALQKTVIYQPLARDLAEVYLKSADAYTERVGDVAAVATTSLEFAAEFAFEFLSEQAKDLVYEAGLTAASTFVPILGFVAGVGLDFAISQMLTWRVGTMTAIYFQNGGEWVGDRKHTLGIAKTLTGGLAGVLKSSKEDCAKNVRVDLDEIPSKVRQVRDSATQTVLPMLRGFADKLPRPVVRESLIAMGLSAIVVDSAMACYYA